MHLRDAKALCDLSLCHVLEEPELEHGSLALGQRRDQGANRFDLEHLVQVGVSASV